MSIFTNLGIPNTIMRFLPTSSNKGGMFTGSLYLLVIVSSLGALAAVLLIRGLSSPPWFVHSSLQLSLISVSLIVGLAVSALLDGTLMAFRRSQYVLKKSLICTVPRLSLPLLAVPLGLTGIVGTYVVVLLVGAVYGLVVIRQRLMVGEPLRPSIGEILAHRSFAAANYFGAVFAVLSGTLLPLLVLAVLGASTAAYFYIPLQIAYALNFITISACQALMAEASQTGDHDMHRTQFRDAAGHLFRVLLPAALFLIGVGWPLLRLYGAAYAAHGYVLLVLLCLSSIFVGTNWLGDTWLNIERRSRTYFIMNAGNALLVVTCVYVFSAHGLVGVGIGYVTGQCISALVYLGLFAHGRLIFSTS